MGNYDYEGPQRYLGTFISTFEKSIADGSFGETAREMAERERKEESESECTRVRK